VRCIATHSAFPYFFWLFTLPSISMELGIPDSGIFSDSLRWRPSATKNLSYYKWWKFLNDNQTNLLFTAANLKRKNSRKYSACSIRYWTLRSRCLPISSNTSAVDCNQEIQSIQKTFSSIVTEATTYFDWTKIPIWNALHHAVLQHLNSS